MSRALLISVVEGPEVKFDKGGAKGLKDERGPRESQLLRPLHVSEKGLSTGSHASQPRRQ
jgi:hypothetical protein